MNHRTAAALLFIALAGGALPAMAAIANSVATADSITTCDQLAGDPNDPETWAGACTGASRVAAAQAHTDGMLAAGAAGMAIAAIVIAIAWRQHRRLGRESGGARQGT